MRPYGHKYRDDGRFSESKGRRVHCPCCPPKFHKGDKTPKRRARQRGKKETVDE